MSNRLETSIFITENREVEGFVLPKLCHGDTIVEVMKGDEGNLNCDALITGNHDFRLGITTADCAPICFGDRERIGIAHVGWRGLCLGLTEKMLLNFEASNLKIFVGPFLHSFEIQKDFCYEAITAKFGDQFITLENKKMIFNFKDAITSLLPVHVEFDGRNTGKDSSLPSHRRNRTSARIVTVVQFKNNSEIG